MKLQNVNLTDNHDILELLRRFKNRPISYRKTNSFQKFQTDLDNLIEYHAFEMKRVFKENPVGFRLLYDQNLNFLDREIKRHELIEQSQVKLIIRALTFEGNILPFLRKVRAKIVLALSKELQTSILTHKEDTFVPNANAISVAKEESEKEELIRQKVIVLYLELIKGNREIENDLNQTSLAKLFVILFGGKESSIRSTICNLRSGKVDQKDLKEETKKLLKNKRYEPKKFDIIPQN
jgi:hypothetical protein